MQEMTELVMAVLAGALLCGTAIADERPLPDILKGARRILFYGDSLTDGSSYPDYVINTLNREFPVAGFEIINAGICGNTAADLVRRLQTDVMALHPDLVIISVGQNDLSQKRKIEDFRADISSLVETLQNAGIRVMLVLPSPRGDPESDKRFLDYLTVLRDASAHYKAPIADAHTLFIEWAKTGREVLHEDGIHHGPDGFECMARAVLNAFLLENAEMDMAVQPWPGLLTEWQTSAPVEKGGEYSPAKAANWTPYDPASLMKKQEWYNSPFPARGAWMPFKDSNTGEAAYGRTFYDATAAGPVELRIGGSTNPQMVWLNGELVWKGGARGYHPDAARTTVKMKKGRNEIVVVSNFMVFIGIHPLSSDGD